MLTLRHSMSAVVIQHAGLSRARRHQNCARQRNNINIHIRVLCSLGGARGVVLVLLLLLREMNGSSRCRCRCRCDSYVQTPFNSYRWHAILGIVRFGCNTARVVAVRKIKRRYYVFAEEPVLAIVAKVQGSANVLRYYDSSEWRTSA